MLIPFFDFGNHHIEGLKSQAGKPYCKARAQVCEVPINKSRGSRKRSVALGEFSSTIHSDVNMCGLIQS